MINELCDFYSNLTTFSSFLKLKVIKFSTSLPFSQLEMSVQTVYITKVFTSGNDIWC